MSGRYRGLLNVEGQPFRVEADVRQDGTELTMALSFASGLEARGRGRLEGREVELELDYGSGCPGSLVLRGYLTEADRRLTGDVQARDCTGRATGSFHLDRP